MGRGNLDIGLRSVCHLVHGVSVLCLLQRSSPSHEYRPRAACGLARGNFVYSIPGATAGLHDLRVPGAPLWPQLPTICFNVVSIQRALHIAIAIYAVSLALQQIIGWPVWACATLIGSVTTLYTVFGGMKAVLWTDVMQFFVLMGGIFAMIGAIFWKFHADPLQIWRIPADAGLTKLFTWDSNFLSPTFWMEMTVWGLLWGTLATNVAAFGSDQVLVQRYIAAGSGRMMTRSLMLWAFLNIPVMFLLYFLGLAFFAYYHLPENAALLASLNELVAITGDDKNMVMPHFIVNVLPSGLGGLVFASLFAATMSVFSSGLNSLSTVTCVDFIQRLRRFQSNSKDVTLGNARWVTFTWGVVVTLASIGVYVAGMGSIVEAAFAVIGFFSGPLLGMFLLGMFSMRANSVALIPRPVRIRIGPAIEKPRIVHLVFRDR